MSTSPEEPFSHDRFDDDLVEPQQPVLIDHEVSSETLARLKKLGHGTLVGHDLREGGKDAESLYQINFLNQEDAREEYEDDAQWG